MTADRIREIAKACGASTAPSLPVNEIVGFELRADGGVNMETAGGARIESAGLAAHVLPEDRGEHRGLFLELLRQLATMTPGGPLRTGVRYQRRSIVVAEGKRRMIFCEAGR